MKRITRPRRHGYRRKGALECLELLVALPILILAALGSVYFGMLLSNLQVLAFASRVGALEAAETDLSETNQGDPVPESVLRAVSDHLISAGIENFQIDLEHDVNGSPTLLRSQVGSNAACDRLPTMTAASQPYVRVIVCVQLDELTPDLMKVFGFSIGGPENTTRHQTIMRYELTTP